MKTIAELMKNLSENRPIFHSEDDFKFAFGQQVIEHFSENPDIEIRFEKPEDIVYVNRIGEEIEPKRVYFDLIIQIEGNLIPIEFKYKTKKITPCIINDECFSLLDQGARDRVRFEFRKDIFRIEYLVNSQKCEDIKKGFSIFLTNDEKYWTQKRGGNTLDANYRFADVIIRKDSGWNNHKIDRNENHWTRNGMYNYKLNLTKQHDVKWCCYSVINNCKFKCMIIECVC